MAYGAFYSSSFGDLIPGAFNMLFIEFASKKAPILLYKSCIYTPFLEFNCSVYGSNICLFYRRNATNNIPK